MTFNWGAVQYNGVFLTFWFPGSRTPFLVFSFIYNIWQDAGIRTRVAATAARCATNELHTSLNGFFKGHKRVLF